MTSPKNKDLLAHQHHADEHNRDPQPTHTELRPEVNPTLRILALRTVEVIAGARDLEQLARWVTDDVYARLHIRVTIAARARAVTGMVAERPRLWIDHVTVAPTENDGYNAVVLVHDRRRPHVVCLKLEGRGPRWLATVLVVM